MAVASNYLENTSTGAEAIYASDNQPDMPEINDVNNLWLLISTALVMLMTPALSLYYGGMVVDGSVLNRMVRTFVSLGIVGVQWLAIGYSLSFASTERAPRLLQKRLYFTLYYSISKGNRALRARSAPLAKTSSISCRRAQPPSAKMSSPTRSASLAKMSSILHAVRLQKKCATRAKRAWPLANKTSSLTRSQRAFSKNELYLVHGRLQRK